MAAFVVLLLLVLGGCSAPLGSSPGPSRAGPETGLVLLHGKWGEPHQLSHLVRTLTASGYIVTAPEMPWSERRLYDADYPAALAEIDAAVRSLHAKGARHVLVGGHSFGANGAIAYAGSGRDVDGVLALAPGHVPDRGGFRATVAASVEQARAMIAAGKPALPADFTDVEQGRTRTIRTTAKTYLSYFDPDGIAAMPKSAAAIPRPVPFLWTGRRGAHLREGADRICLRRGRGRRRPASPRRAPPQEARAWPETTRPPPKC